MAWRYTFDDGPEKPLDNPTTLYSVAAMAAFAAEEIRFLHTLKEGFGINDYEGHIVKLWDTELADLYSPSIFGLAYNVCGTLTLPTLGKATQ